MTDEFPRSTSSVVAHVEAERSMQVERWGWRGDAMKSDAQWNALITARLLRPGASRYIRLVQVAALAIAAAEREHPTGDHSVEAHRD